VFDREREKHLSNIKDRQPPEKTRYRHGGWVLGGGTEKHLPNIKNRQPPEAGGLGAGWVEREGNVF